jgi:glycosyltransferase involved in cell wall biosynthesis
MKVSCLCPTYGRAPRLQHLIEETVESFLRQDYSDKELLILNDQPDQELICRAPGVTVLNIKKRFRSLGEKYNAIIALTDGDLLMTWEDDDIALPWRISLSVEMLGAADYYNPHRYWYMDTSGLHKNHSMGVGHNSSIYTRRAYETVGGYPFISGAQDAVMDARLMEHPRVDKVDAPFLPPEKWFYIYRWGVSPVHLSGKFPHGEWYREIGTHPYEKGKFELQPRWQKDYMKLRDESLKS